MARSAPTAAAVVVAAVIGGAAGPAHAQAAGTVRGAVVDEQGQPAPGALIILLPLQGGAPAAGGGAAVEIDSGADGRFAQPDVPAGLYAATATRGDRRSDVYRVRVRDRRTVDIRFALESGRRAAPWVVAASDGGDLDELFQAGVAASRNGAHAEAIAYFSLAADLYPSCLACPYNTAVAYRALGQWVEAERAFRSTLAVRADYAAAYYGLTDIYARLGRPEAAAAAGRRDAGAAVARGVPHFHAGRLEEARKHFEDAVGHITSHAPGYYWLGLTLAELGQPEPAAEALRRAVSLDATGEHAAYARSRLVALEHER